MKDSIDIPDDEPKRAAADEIHRLAIRQIDGSLTDEERAELMALLQGDAAARRVYLEHMQDTVSLRWMFNGHLHRGAALELAEHGPERLHVRQRRLSQFVFALAASLVCIAAAIFWRANQDVAKTAAP